MYNINFSFRADKTIAINHSNIPFTLQHQKLLYSHIQPETNFFDSHNNTFLFSFSSNN